MLLRWARLGSNQRPLACKATRSKRCADLRKRRSTPSESAQGEISLNDLFEGRHGLVLICGSLVTVRVSRTILIKYRTPLRRARRAAGASCSRASSNSWTSGGGGGGCTGGGRTRPPRPRQNS